MNKAYVIGYLEGRIDALEKLRDEATTQQMRDVIQTVVNELTSVLAIVQA